MLDLNDLGSGSIPGLSGAAGAAMAEAAGVCLESQDHTPGVRLSVTGNGGRSSYSLQWPPISAQSRRTWNDPEEATENGAGGIAALLIIRETGYVPIARSRKGTGIDYWLGDVANATALEYQARLEVSGLRRGDGRAVRNRVRQKLAQTAPSDQTELPAYVIVVEFSTPQAEVRRK